MNYEDVYSFLRRGTDDGTRLLPKIGELVRKADASGHGYTYHNSVESLAKLFAARGRPLAITPGGDKQSVRIEGAEAISRLLRRVSQGERAIEAHIFLEWLDSDVARSALLDGFLQEHGYSDPTARESIKYDAFLCWSGPYGRAICEKVRQFFSDSGTSVFMSSEDIANGAEWEAALEKSLKASAQGLVVITQDAIGSDFLTHEFAVLSAKTARPQILLLDAPAAILPVSLRRFQHNTFTTPRLISWVKGLLNKRDIAVSSQQMVALASQIDEIVARFRPLYVTAEEKRWKDSYGLCILISQQANSPFDLEQVVSTAQERLVLVAQNHWFMTKSDYGGHLRFWPQIEAALLRGVQIDIVGMHVDVAPSGMISADVPNAFDLWSHFMQAPSFHTHGAETWEVLETWVKLYDDLKLKSSSVAGLNVYGAYLTPLTISLVDPESDRGYLVLSPRVNNESSFARPQFVLRKSSEAIAFDYYSQATLNSFANAGWKRLFV